MIHIATMRELGLALLYAHFSESKLLQTPIKCPICNHTASNLVNLYAHINIEMRTARPDQITHDYGLIKILAVY